MEITSPKYIFNQAIQISPAEDTASIPMVLCEVPATLGKSSKFAAPAQLVDLLRLFDGNRSPAAVLTAYTAARNSTPTYTLERLELLISTFCLPRRILLPDRPGLEHQSFANTSPLKYLYCRLRLLPNAVVEPVAQRVTGFFSKPAALAIGLVVLVAHLIFYIASRGHLPLSLARGQTLAAAGLLSIMAALCHELGHAAAYARGGGRGAEIGCGLYLYIPVFYTDLEDTWKFNRSARVLVDIGGVYFQSIVSTIAIIFYFSIHAVACYYAVFLITVSAAASLNPFLRMDGYWFVADVFGISNLRLHSLLLVKYSIRRLIGKGGACPAFFSVLSRKTKYLLVVYTLLSSGFFVYLIATIARQTIFVLIPQYPSVVVAITKGITGNPTDIFEMVVGIVSILWRTMIVGAVGFCAWRTAHGIYRYVAQLLAPPTSLICDERSNN
jgi:putative peptide zinc metalloprotease protein